MTRKSCVAVPLVGWAKSVGSVVTNARAVSSCPGRVVARFPVLMALLVGAFCLSDMAAAADVPFTTEHTVDGTFDGAISVYAADVDGDGDTDVLGAAYDADEITWWENTTGDGTTWTERTIDAAFDGAISVYAADVDGDGDTDVLGAADIDGEITWWENTAGAGTTWAEHTIAAALNFASSVYAADVDGDGDTDVLGAAQGDDAITWWENTAGDGST